jgi:hypothetical protein
MLNPPAGVLFKLPHKTPAKPQRGSFMMIQRTGNLLPRLIPDFPSNQPEKTLPARRHNLFYPLYVSLRPLGHMKVLYYFSICRVIIFVPLMEVISIPLFFGIKNGRNQAQF